MGPQARPGRRPRSARQALGAEGERRAAEHLARQGYRIEARNVRADGVELDVVARRGRLVVIVEVKTRRSRRFGPPELAVDHAKRARLVRGAAAWLHEHGGHGARVRFDVVAWEVDPGSPPRWRIHHLEGAFEAGD
jgi:putative endonuclease